MKVLALSEHFKFDLILNLFYTFNCIQYNYLFVNTFIVFSSFFCSILVICKEKLFCFNEYNEDNRDNLWLSVENYFMKNVGCENIRFLLTKFTINLTQQIKLINVPRCKSEAFCVKMFKYFYEKQQKFYSRCLPFTLFFIFFNII